MESKRKILFIINPISGVGRQKLIENSVEQYLDKEKFDFDFKYTEYAKHAIEITENEKENFDVIVAIGGDGTVNEIGSVLTGTDKTMAIIPTGSGNGLARFLKIPLNPVEAIKNINTLKVEAIDTAMINQDFFGNVAGLGFDALISHKFAKGKKRGFISYLKIILKEYFSYKGTEYKLKIDGKEFRFKGFLLSLANSSQFGNDGFIAPYAKIDDGALDICMLKPFPKWLAPEIGIRLMTKSIHKSSYMRIVRGKEIEIKNTGETWAHVDGEPITLQDDIKIRVKQKSLNVLVGEDFFL